MTMKNFNVDNCDEIVYLKYVEQISGNKILNLINNGGNLSFLKNPLVIVVTKYTQSTKCTLYCLPIEFL